jgi:hypothetical protein
LFARRRRRNRKKERHTDRQTGWDVVVELGHGLAKVDMNAAIVNDDVVHLEVCLIFLRGGL